LRRAIWTAIAHFGRSEQRDQAIFLAIRPFCDQAAAAPADHAARKISACLRGGSFQLDFVLFNDSFKACSVLQKAIAGEAEKIIAEVRVVTGRATFPSAL
jgi:hypothetical protein